MTLKSLVRNRSVFLYGASLAVLLMFLKVLEWRMLLISHAYELYAGAIAILFTGLGMWLAHKLTHPRPKTVIIEKEIFVKTDYFVFNHAEVARLRLSNRELEVLQLMGDGLSNLQIADRLFLSLNTIKTHSSKIFGKLEVQRRTQAVEKARKLSIIL
ncbi:LuxR C-terminal-related transcriptional regulator [Pedobacter sp. MC2016-15]|uniref:response regulator transcription factor n=1 Tax=Pedobacter sp. MC2016-15 TaxID=2994473 RepID=UPI00224779EC|nr:LuxR C-terminal-related transcriptional regulator [Pedobacter sp. MC2016-15]MCX2480564.1 LuxR C-terminal-related transcriptional regulator [Pedobacter sp. MC2016-15]